MDLITRKKASAGSVFVAIVIILFCAVSIVPSVPLNYVRMIQMIATVLLSTILLLNNKQSKVVRRITIGLIGFISLILLYWWTGYSDASSGNYFYQISFFVPLAGAIYCFRKMPRWLMLAIYFAILAMMSIHLIRDIFIGNIYQGYSMEELSDFGSSVLLTSFSTASMLVLNISLLIFLNTNNMRMKWIHVVVIALTFYFIVFCGQRGSVVVLLLISVFLLLYERFNKSNSKNDKRLIPLALGVAILLIFSDNIIDFLIQISPNDRLTDRFIDMKGTLQQGASADSFSGRLSLEIISIRSWLRDIISFFFGIGDHRNEDFSGIQGFITSGIGGHSELIDSLARYGIIGFSILAYLYVNICKYILSLFQDEKVRNQVRPIIFVSVLTSLTKTVFYPEIGICLFLLLPFSSVILNKNYY